MKRQTVVIELTHENVREICDAIRDGFSSIALALGESLGFGSPAACIQSAARAIEENTKKRNGKAKAK